MSNWDPSEMSWRRDEGSLSLPPVPSAFWSVFQGEEDEEHPQGSVAFRPADASIPFSSSRRLKPLMPMTDDIDDDYDDYDNCRTLSNENVGTRIFDLTD
mmetsp:Transcript_47304/g.115483  ORF Transcript_47304/g.115483 Transcript_47304/m.115483 type:complete len:99 (-) Transcript_47304:153-449(-)